MKLYQLSLLLICLLNACDLHSQKEDYHWCLGYNGERNVYRAPFGGIDMKFTEDSVFISYARRPTEFDDCNASICDEDGNLLLYTNGIYAANGQNKMLVFGGGLDEWTTFGNQSRQGAFIVPMPGTLSDTFIIVHNFFDVITKDDKAFPAIFDIYYSLADMTYDDGYGTIYRKKELVISDTIGWGIPAVRHANGRDWWFPLLKKNGKGGFMCLIDPSGVTVVDTFQFSEPWIIDSPQLQFSPDGSKLINVVSPNIYFGYSLDILDFDRCVGKFGNRNQILVPHDTIYSSGMAISPSGQFVYVSAYDEVHQYDLYAQDIEASRIVVAEADDFETIPGFNTLKFRSMGVAPNGKIYITGPGTTLHLHTIHAPDSAGLDCRVGLHDVELPAYTFSTMPNIPNHRLGPIDGSLCDSLGINNVPLARFRHTGQHLVKQFLDMSAYEPSYRTWYFGDGITSNEIHPEHMYMKAGIYKVCLEVSNTHGKDSTCRPVWVDTTFTTSSPIPIKPEVHFYPSPSRDKVNLQVPQTYYPFDFIMSDIAGREVVMKTNIQNSSTEFSFGHLSSGLYLVRIMKKGKVIWEDQWVKN